MEANVANSALEQCSREGKESTVPLERNEAGSIIEQNPDKDDENTERSEHNEADSSLGHRMSSSSSSSNSSLRSITVENSRHSIEIETFSEDAEEHPMESMQCHPTQSPPTQTMGRSSGYDPNRIPASVFASKPSSPMDWSVASNESLFSIHVGNSSFSKDQFHLMMGPSGELPRLDEEFDTTGLPTVLEGVDSYSQCDDKYYSSRLKEASGAHKNAGSTGTAEDFNKYRMPYTDDISGSVGSPATPRISISRSEDTRASDVSTRSFAFPVLFGDGRKSKSGHGEAIKHKTHSNRQPESSSGQQLQQDTSKSTLTPGCKCWFSCFPCCCQICS